MKAWLIDKLEGLKGLRLAQVPDPVPEPHEVLLRVHYAALNPADSYLAQNLYPAKPSLPHILGRDGMGTVVQVGAQVRDVRTGDRRAILRGAVGGDRPGTFAELVAVPAQDLVELPDGWTELEAAGATLVYLTAHQALTMWGPLPGEAIVLVTGASGGVGIACIQLAAAMGHKVLALSRSSDKRRRLEQLGAAAVFDPQAPKWRLDLKGSISPRRVDLAIDNIGGKLLPEVIDTLGELGRVSLVGRLAGPVPSFNTATLFFRRLRMGGVAVGAWSNAESRSAWTEVLSLLSRARTKPQVDQVFAFECLPDAFERLAQGPMGKVLLSINPESRVV